MGVLKDDLSTITKRDPGSPGQLVHADACMSINTAEVAAREVYPDGTCRITMDRAYSSLLYLTGSEGGRNFVGGDFFFSPNWRGEKKELVSPRCGRLVAFSADGMNYHGVTPVKEGRGRAGGGERGGGGAGEEVGKSGEGTVEGTMGNARHSTVEGTMGNARHKDGTHTSRYAYAMWWKREQAT
jgi:hypothetical protein